LEAADEVARQLRLRDLGGLIVIDFIDMTPSRHQREVENRLRDALKQDRARVQVGRISRFGLLEMSRQRLRPALAESSHEVCPRCSGAGTIRGIESLALSILRVVEEEAMKENTGRINAQVPVEVAAYLLNEKRRSLSEIENRHRIDVILIPNPHVETPHFDIQRVRKSDKEEMSTASFDMVQAPASEEEAAQPVQALRSEEPAVKTLIPQGPAPMREEKAQKPEGSGFIRKLFSTLFGNGEETKEKKPAATKDAKRSPQREKGSRAQGGRRSQAQGQGQRQGQGQGQRRRSRKPAGNKQQQTKTDETAAATTEGKQQEKPKTSSSRRGRRGGRRRRDSDAQGKAANADTKQQNTGATAGEAAGSGSKGNGVDTSSTPKPAKNTDAGAATQTATAGNKPAAAPAPASAAEQAPKSSTTDSTPVIRPTAAGNSVIPHPAGQKPAADSPVKPAGKAPEQQPAAKVAESQTPAPQQKPAGNAPVQQPAQKVTESQAPAPQQKPAPVPAAEPTQKPADKSLTMVETRPELVKQPEAGGKSST
jgi:ribonuclease E